jgi:uncharacterized protein
MQPRLLASFAAAALHATSFSLKRSIAQSSRPFPFFPVQKQTLVSSRSLHRAQRYVSTSDIESVHDSDDHIRRRTNQWVQKVVIGLNLCPFADLPFRQKKLKIDVFYGKDQDRIVMHVMSELIDRCRLPGTTIVVCPDFYPKDFLKYLETVGLIEDLLMEDDSLVGTVQIAPFHPLFQFEGSDVDGFDNFTNRSPYPIFHVLREDEVTNAVDQLDGDAGKVWRRNIALLDSMESEMGKDAFEQVMRGEVDEGSELAEKTREALRRFRVQLGSQKPPM